MIITILLILILLVLIGIYVACKALYSNMSEGFNRISVQLGGLFGSLDLLSNRICDVIENIKRIDNTADDIRFHINNLEKHEISQALQTLKSIDLEVNELRQLDDAVQSLREIESSLKTIESHPAFSPDEHENIFDIIESTK
jgi:hypothetical protein